MAEKLKPFVKNLEEVKPFTPPKHFETHTWPLVTPDAGGPESVELSLTEIKPDGKVLEHMHEVRDHVYYVISGHGLIEIGKKSFELNPGDAIFIPRGFNHALELIGEETLRMIVLFAPAEG